MPERSWEVPVASLVPCDWIWTHGMPLEILGSLEAMPGNAASWCVLARRPDTGQRGNLLYASPEAAVSLALMICDHCKSAGHTRAGTWIHDVWGLAACRRGAPGVFTPQRVQPVNMFTTPGVIA
jgi:hypothetical protein